MANEQDYLTMLKTFFENETPMMKIDNHAAHNNNPDYWDILLGPLKDGDWSEKTTLDFGCGCGRNVQNILNTFKVKEAHGCDISSANVAECTQALAASNHENYFFYTNEGNSLAPSPSDKYDFIMSTIVLQHIPCHSIRKSILTDMYRCLTAGGILSFQMGFGNAVAHYADYYDNVYDATSTNSRHDTKVTDPSQLISDLTEIGFKDIKHTISHSWVDFHNQWIFVNCMK
jgi:SAM-dependent methyltransferase